MIINPEENSNNESNEESNDIFNNDNEITQNGTHNQETEWISKLFIINDKNVFKYKCIFNFNKELIEQKKLKKIFLILIFFQ